MSRKVISIISAVLVAALLVLCGVPAVMGENAGAEIKNADGTPAPPIRVSAAQSVAPAAEEPATAHSPSPSPVPPPPPVETPGPGKAIIIFTFDDGPLSDYLLAYPILKEYGIKGTSYIITKFVDAETAGKLTWEQIKEMAEYGWVFGAHTYGHKRLAKLDGDEIKADCEAVKQSFINQGLKPPEIMAYPYGSYSKSVIEAMKPYYVQARLAYYRNDFVDLGGSPYKIACISADMRTNSALRKKEKLVDKACEEGAIIVFRVHTLYKDKPYDTVKRNTHIFSGCAPQTDSKLFAKLVKYCAEAGCGFMTMTELMDYMEGKAE